MAANQENITSLKTGEEEPTRQEVLHELSEYFVRETSNKIIDTFWEAFDQVTSERFPERHISKIKRIIEQNGLDRPQFRYIKGTEAIENLKEMDIDWMADLDRAQDGILVYELPKVLSKKWWREQSVSSDNTINLIPWHDIYEKTVEKIHGVRRTYEADHDLLLERINPFYYHEPGKYYYVWYVDDIENKTDEFYQDDVEEYFDRKWICLGKKNLEQSVGLALETICPPNTKGVYLHRPDRALKALGENFESQLFDEFLDALPTDKTDRIVFPYYPASLGRKLNENEQSRLFDAIDYRLSEQGEAYIFPIPPEEINETLIEWVKNLSPHLWQNGGTLDFELTGTFDDRALRIKKVSQEKIEQLSNEEAREAILDICDAIIPHNEDGTYDIEATHGLCRQISQNIVRAVAGKYRHSFDRAALIQSYGFNFKRDRGWGHRYYFLLHSIDETGDGTYFMGSPANLELTPQVRDKNSLEIFESSSLTEILAKITNYEGGGWPSAPFIENTPYMPPIITNKYGSSDSLICMSRG